MTDYPKDDWRNAVPECEEYDRDALIAFREELATREQTDADFTFVTSMSTSSVEAYCALCEAWDKQFGQQPVSDDAGGEQKEHDRIDESTDLKTRIQQRLDRLETYMKENKRDKAQALIPDIAKFWSALSQADQEYIQCVRIALKDNIEWKVP